MRRVEKNLKGVWQMLRDSECGCWMRSRKYLGHGQNQFSRCVGQSHASALPFLYSGGSAQVVIPSFCNLSGSSSSSQAFRHKPGISSVSASYGCRYHWSLQYRDSLLRVLYVSFFAFASKPWPSRVCLVYPASKECSSRLHAPMVSRILRICIFSLGTLRKRKDEVEVLTLAHQLWWPLHLLCL